MKDAQTILDMHNDRVRRGVGIQAHSRMQRISDIYNGRARVNIPDIDGDKAPPIPNLVAQGIDQIAGRIASVAPQVTFTPRTKNSRRSDRQAATASRVISAWWAKDDFAIKMRQRARHLVAYAASPVTIRWNHDEHRPTWQIRDPLTSWPNPDHSVTDTTPPDIIFTYRRTAGWLRTNGYAAQLAEAVGPTRLREMPPTAPLTIVEYADSEGITCVLSPEAGSGGPGDGWPDVTTGGRPVLLEFEPTPGMTSFVISRIGLDSSVGQFDNMVEMYQMQGRLAALEIMAVEKGIFPDTYLISRPGELGKFIDGPYDGRTGQVNIVAGGDVKEMNPQPGYLTNPTIDRLERNQRVSGGIPPEFGGESSTGIRTGRRGDAVLSATIDHPVGEAQEIFAAGLVFEDKAAISLARFHDGRNERTLRVTTGNATQPITYVADQVFVDDDHVVTYPAAGADMNSLIIGLGQRVGLGTMSKETAAKLDPYIADPHYEHDRIIVEGLEMALVGGIQQQAAAGQLPPAVLARLISLVGSDKLEVAEAMEQIVAEAQAQQEAAQAAQQAGQTPGPDALGAGAAQQALAGEQSVIPGPNPSQEDLGSLLLALRQPTMSRSPSVAPGTV